MLAWVTRAPASLPLTPSPPPPLLQPVSGEEAEAIHKMYQHPGFKVGGGGEGRACAVAAVGPAQCAGGACCSSYWHIRPTTGAKSVDAPTHLLTLTLAHAQIDEAEHASVLADAKAVDAAVKNGSASVDVAADKENVSYDESAEDAEEVAVAQV